MAATCSRQATGHISQDAERAGPIYCSHALNHGTPIQTRQSRSPRRACPNPRLQHFDKDTAGWGHTIPSPGHHFAWRQCPETAAGCTPSFSSAGTGLSSTRLRQIHATRITFTRSHRPESRFRYAPGWASSAGTTAGSVQTEPVPTPPRSCPPAIPANRPAHGAIPKCHLESVTPAALKGLSRRLSALAR